MYSFVHDFACKYAWLSIFWIIMLKNCFFLFSVIDFIIYFIIEALYFFSLRCSFFNILLPILTLFILDLKINKDKITASTLLHH